MNTYNEVTSKIYNVAQMLEAHFSDDGPFGLRL